MPVLPPRSPNLLKTAALAALFLFVPGGSAQETAAPGLPVALEVPAHMQDDGAAVWLAMRCAEGGERGRRALVAALDRMGWRVKDKDGRVLREPQLATPTGLALRDHEIEMLFWNLEDQPGIRLIAYAQALTVVFPTADAEDLAQGLLDAIRAGAESDNPQRRFWARFIIGLGMTQNGSDLVGPGDPHVILPDPGEMKGLMPTIPEQPDDTDDEDEATRMRRGMAAAMAMMKSGGVNIAAIAEASTPRPAWPTDDPVLGTSPAPEQGGSGPGSSSPGERMDRAEGEMQELFETIASGDQAKAAAAQIRLAVLQQQIMNLTQAIQVSAHQRMVKAIDPDADGDESDSSDDRFMAEHRTTPLSLLQAVLLTRVLVADLLGEPPPPAGTAQVEPALRIVRASLLPFSAWQIAQAPAGGPPTSFGGQVASAGADMWATGWGAYTGHILDVNLPNSKFSDRVGKANAIMGWIKTIVLLARNKITVEVENVPLVRTKTRTAGQKRQAKCVVIVDFPKTPDALKALRAVLNITSIDFQVPEGGPVSGAKVVWRLPEGSYNGKYATKGGGSTYRPDLAVVQFAGLKPGAKGTSAYTSFTNDAGEAFIDIEGAPQRKELPKEVRPQPRRATVAVEVTMKVGNLMQDINDAVGAAGTTGAPGVTGVITFISEMIQRTPLFFQKGRAFEVTDWAKPAWEGEFVVTVSASGSLTEAMKQGPPVHYEWKMSRAMEARVQSPEWDQEEALEKGANESDVSILELSNDTKRYKVADFSSQAGAGVEAAFTAEGPVEIQPAARNRLQIFSRSEPSGYGRLHTFPQSGQYQLSLEPFFAATAQIFNYERTKNRSRTENRVGPYDLLQGVHPSDLTGVGTYDPASGMISGKKTIDGRGSLPHVPGFDVTIEFAYTLRYNSLPPKNAR